MSETRFGAWTAPESNVVAVEYSLVVIEEIRQAVTEGFQRFARGGIEVGGVLYGTYEGKTARILAVREIACEHAHGPSFVLSHKDRSALSDQLERDRKDVRLEGFQALGFYVSHTRSDIVLQPGDQETYEAFFSELWQVVLVVRPGRAGAMRAGFFVREADGTVKTDHSYLDFNFPERVAIPPLLPERPSADRGAARRAAADSSAPDTAVPDRASSDRPGPERSGPDRSGPERAPIDKRPSAFERLGLPAYEPSGFEPAEASFAERGSGYAAQSPELATEFATDTPQDSSEPPVRSPGFTPAPEPKSNWPRWLLSAAVVLAVGVLGIAGLRYFGGQSYLGARAPAEPISLAVFEHEGGHAGQLRIEWNHNAAPIRNAAMGTLDISDGKDVRTLMLSKEDLLRGSFTYARHSGDVQVRLEVQNAGGEKTQEASRFLGAAVTAVDEPAADPKADVSAKPAADPAEVSAVQKERDAFQQEVMRLRRENAAQVLRNQQLERTLTILRLRLGIATPGDAANPSQTAAPSPVQQ